MVKWRDKDKLVACKELGPVWSLKPNIVDGECVFWSGDELTAYVTHILNKQYHYTFRVKRKGAPSHTMGTTIAGKILLPSDWASRTSDSRGRLLCHEGEHVVQIDHYGVIRFNAGWAFSTRRRAALEFAAYRASVRALCLLGGSKESVHRYIEHLVDTTPKTYLIRIVKDVKVHMRSHLLSAIPPWSLAA